MQDENLCTTWFSAFVQNLATHTEKYVCLLIYTFQNYDFFLLSILWKKISKFNDRIWKEFIIKLYYFFQTLDLILEKNLHLILEFRE